jgi:hypothetical protein
MRTRGSNGRAAEGRPVPSRRGRRGQRRVVRAARIRDRVAPSLRARAAPLRRDLARRRTDLLSEHTGDARPDTLLYLYVDDVDTVATGFGVDPVEAPYGVREIELRDPDGNRLRLGTRLPG